MVAKVKEGFQNHTSAGRYRAVPGGSVLSDAAPFPRHLHRFFKKFYFYNLRCIFVAQVAISLRDNKRFISHGFCHCDRHRNGRQHCSNFLDQTSTC